VCYEYNAEGSYTSEADTVQGRSTSEGPELGGKQTFPQNSDEAALCLYIGKRDILCRSDSYVPGYQKEPSRIRQS